MIGSPRNLEVLLHHYYSPMPYGGKAVEEVNEMLLRNSMITVGAAPGVFDVTEKGRYFIQYLLKIPFPQPTWHIPDFEE